MQEEVKQKVKEEHADDLVEEGVEEQQEVGNVEEQQLEEDAQEQAEANTAESEERENKIAELEQLLKDKEERYLRLHADFDNFRRRTQIDREADKKYRAQSLVSNLLPAVDNLERAMDIQPNNEQTKSLLEGVKMVYQSILDALKSEGVEQIEAVGKQFDPNLHQAVMQADEEDVKENVVVEEFQKGYILKGRVIRPSMVKVNK